MSATTSAPAQQPSPLGADTTPSLTCSAAFEALRRIGDAHDDLESTLGDFTRLIDHAVDDFDASVTMERHFKSDVAALAVEIQKAREVILEPLYGGPDDGLGGEEGAADPSAAPPEPEKVPTPPHDPASSHFDVLDPVMQRWVDVKGVIAMLLCGLDGNPDKAAVETMRRHAQADLDRMGVALKAAWAALVVAKGKRS